MRCKACNAPLTPFEATRKSVSTGEYLELCNDDFNAIADEVPVIERFDLLGKYDVDEE